MESNPLTLGVILVSYNTCDLLRNALHSVYAAAARPEWVHPPRLQVVVVDNASQDGSVEMVRTIFPDVHLIASEHNLGFTAANNVALRELGFRLSAEDANTATAPHPDYVLLLNPDAELVDDALWQMVRFLEQTPSAGICGAHLRYGDGTFQHGAFFYPSLSQVVLDLWPVWRIPGGHRLYDSSINGRYSQRCWQGRQPFRVDFVLGAAMLARGDAVDGVGGLDEGFFMYSEEIDWCLRMQQQGWEIWAVPEAHVLHHEAQSSGQVRWATFQRLWSSRLRFFRKHQKLYPPGYARLIRWCVRLGLMWHSRVAWRQFARGEISGAQLADALSAYAAVDEAAQWATDFDAD